MGSLSTRADAKTKAFVILDGILLSIDRVAADRLYYSGKHKCHGMNVQVIAAPFGRLLCAAPALPGAVHDIRAARNHSIIEALSAADVGLGPTMAVSVAEERSGCPTGAAGARFRPGRRAVNSSHARIRAVGEQTNVTPKAGVSCANSVAAPPAQPTSSRLSWPCNPQRRYEAGESGSMDRDSTDIN
ncbi:transposase family protein [Streptomyces sp. NPDC055013]